MLPTDADNLTSTKIRELLPDFVDAEYPIFVQFLRSYYEWMEQTDQTLGASNRMLSYRDVDSTLDDFIEHFRVTFLANLPKDSAVSVDRLTAHVRELYRAKGSPDAYRLLFRLVFNKDVELFYPRENIIRSSDGVWSKETSLKVGWCENADELTGREIRGATSGATARVEYVNEYYDGALHVLELFVNKKTVMGTFQIGEYFETVDDGVRYCEPIYGCVTGLTINAPGLDYAPGDRLIFAEGLSGGGGAGAAAQVKTVGTQAISGVEIIDPGAGYVVGDVVTFTSSTGNGAAAVVSSISPGNLLFEDGEVWAMDDTDGDTYAATIEDTTYYFIPVPLDDFLAVALNAANYDTVTNHDLATANLASVLSVADGSSPQDFGTPAKAYGKITGIEMIAGGSGYRRVPTLTVVNNTAINIEATHAIDIYTAAQLRAITGAGQIKTIQLDNFGVGYAVAPDVTLALSGDGTANVTATVGALCEYTGRYIGTNGRPSSDKKIQDAHYYQPYSYVIKVDENISRYRSLVKKLLHPAGAIFFGEYSTVTEVDGSMVDIISEIARDAPDAGIVYIMDTADVSANAESMIYVLEFPHVVANTSNGMAWAAQSDLATFLNVDVIYFWANTVIDDLDTNEIDLFVANNFPTIYTTP